MKVRVVFKNETIQTVILMAIMIAGVATFWFGLGIVLRTEYPLLAVISKSMLPTLNVGDYIVVQGVNASEIKAEKIIGDIIVFPSPGPRNSGELIVHRAIGKTRGNDGELYFQTRG
ncbi:signal peptidase I, partial [Candidatus Bathyarchaeota archaeon]|nr:signal peptidase I [Candidatus Bathyarchaeota archaeon]NIR16412.1 signal peptidase I [Desulfobacterales bacterium]NIU81513.1 signal peptidase I [Candidatus Bathyarchaeota archaeon]NIV68159.1 signal peptidase I [Candidatus Bathyarchaeota archaeon]NIW16534.1 signal peptidase I [Candidatus Bathyarchaeota archaeon]